MTPQPHPPREFSVSAGMQPARLGATNRFEGHPPTRLSLRGGHKAHPDFAVTEVKPSAHLADRGGLLDDVDHQPHPDRQGPLVEVERRLMQVQLRTAA